MKFVLALLFSSVLGSNFADQLKTIDNLYNLVGDAPQEEVMAAIEERRTQLNNLMIDGDDDV
jgi:hypothetical protein